MPDGSSLLSTQLAVQVASSVRRVNAIDEHWATPPLDLPPYLPPDADEAAPLEPEALEASVRALEQLLHAPMYVFWSRLLHDRSLSDFLDGVLRFSPRGFGRSAPRADRPNADEADGSAGEGQLRACLLRVLLRLASPEEDGGAAALPPADWSSLVYDRWLLDAPKLLDASALFGFSNPALARRLLASAVRLEPRYADDLAEAIGAAAEALSQASGADPLASAPGAGSREVWSLPFASAAELRSASAPDSAEA
mmetsp:Transcript_11013/g.36587  ORF Transcript_11013/g.36587 Transcript_11013/m.36587 type:complete len:253 (-) Transcript_11013:497-1255(-)